MQNSTNNASTIMASKVFNEGKENILDWFVTTATIKVLLLMTNTTADTENDGISEIGDLATLDEHDGSGYARGTLASKTAAKDDANDRATFDAADVTFATLGAGSRDVAGVLLCWDDGGTLRPISWHEYQSPRIADGADFVVQWRSDTGLMLAQ